MNSENSALMALSELKNLEADRVAQVHADHQSEIEAKRLAQEAAERQAREIAEQQAREEAERLAAEQAAREAREREERIRVAEAEARSRAEQEARLAEEQMRIDAQMKLAEQKSKPKWPLFVVPLLVLGLGGLGFMYYSGQKEAAEKAAVAAAERAKIEEQAAADRASFQATLERLEKERKKQDAKLAGINKQLSETKSDAERAKLLAEKQALEAKIAATEEEQETTKKKTGKKKSRGGAKSKAAKPKAASDDPAPVTKVRKKKINLGSGDDPLDGL
ncbi:MAG: hypothetical protein ACRBN8_43745 [Nannocystales bacterium]